MKTFDLVSREKYKGRLHFIMRAFFINIFGSAFKSLIGLLFLYGGVIYVFTLPDETGLLKVFGTFGLLFFTFINVSKSNFFLGSKVVISQGHLWVDYKEKKYHETPLSDVIKILRVEHFNGCFRVIYKSKRLGQEFFNIYSDILPDELKAFLEVKN